MHFHSAAQLQFPLRACQEVVSVHNRREISAKLSILSLSLKVKSAVEWTGRSRKNVTISARDVYPQFLHHYCKMGDFTFLYSCLACDWNVSPKARGCGDIPFHATRSVYKEQLLMTLILPTSITDCPEHVLGSRHVIHPSPSDWTDLLCDWPAVWGPLIPLPRVTFDPLPRVTFDPGQV